MRMSVKSVPFWVSESRSATMMIECANVDGPASDGCSTLLTHPATAARAAAPSSVTKVVVRMMVRPEALFGVVGEIAKLHIDPSRDGDFVAVLVVTIEGDLGDRRDESQAAA